MGCRQENTFTYDNVVVIIGDDHSKWAITQTNALVATPNLDKLINSGISFNNAYCTSPICSPSRQSMLTGKYPHATGVSLLFAPFNDTQNETIAEHAQKTDIETALIGKTHFNNWIWYNQYAELPKHGFDTLLERSYYRKNVLPTIQNIPDSILTRNSYQAGTPQASWNTRYLPSPCYDEDCSGTFLANQAKSYLTKNKNNRFLLWLAFHEPHAPFEFPIEYAGKIDTSKVQIPVLSELDKVWVPKIFNQFSPAEKKGAIASYLTSTMYMDKNIGLVLDHLEKLGLTENTLIIYASDNGYLQYDHGRLEKHSWWQQSTNVPLVMKGKNLTAQRNERLVSYLDLAPTIAEALGLPPMPEAQGESVLKRLATDTYDDFVFSEYLEDNMAMIRNERYKYVFLTGKRDLGLKYATGHGAPGITEMLFDLLKDPEETTDISQENSEIVKKMRSQMIAEFQRTHPERANEPQDMNDIGKLIWYCEPRDVGAEYGGVPLRVN